MVKCLQCGALLAAPVMEVPGVAVCPCCGGSQMISRSLCAGCGRETAEESLVEGFCPRCAAETLGSFRRMMGAFGPGRRELLNTMLDGERL